MQINVKKPRVLAPLPFLGSLVIVVSACGATDSAETVPTSATTVPTSAAESRGAPDPGSSLADLDASDLSKVVANTIEELGFTEAAQLGTDVIRNNLLNEQINDCINKSGYQYRGLRVFGIEGRRPDDQNIYFRGVSPFWHTPPRVEAARTFGLRGNADDPSTVIDIPPAETRTDLKPPTGEDYLLVEQSCINEFPRSAEVPGLDIVQMLDSEIQEISHRTQQLDGFQTISDKYRACVLAAGYGFSDPSELFELQPSDSFTADSTEFDNEIAVVDAECRAPLYSAFIELNADEWTDWLERRESDIATAISAAAEYEQVALAAWQG